MKKITALIFKNTHPRIWFIVTCSFMACLITATIIVSQNKFLYETISVALGGERRILAEGEIQDGYFASDYKSKEATLAAANALNEKIAEEGIVLLKNENSLPLALESKISVFGANSVNLVYGGSGSGGTSDNVLIDLYDSLISAKFDVNPVLKSFYNGVPKRDKNPIIESGVLFGFGTGETPQSSYTATVKNSYSQYNDAALVVFSRIGGEGFDLPRTMFDSKSGNIITGARNKDDHYLQLDQNETDLLDAVCKEFSNVIVILNSSTAMELGFLDDSEHYAYHAEIKGALWIGSLGKTGIMGLGRILNGGQNPSGRLIDTYVRNFKNDPALKNFSNNNTLDGNKYITSEGKPPSSNGQSGYFVEYKEGIYIGYRYYETRGFTEFEESGNYSWYDKAVVYPFGYGLSYTDFFWDIKSWNYTADTVLSQNATITVEVEVTNNGGYDGKDIVQLYFSAPYKGGVEKSHVVLGGFAKTGTITKGGGKDTVEISMKVSDMASYDYNNKSNMVGTTGGWVLEGGEYKLFVSQNAHSWAKGAESIVFNIPAGGYTFDSEKDGDETQYKYKDKSGNAINNAARNRFKDVSDYIENRSKYLSRSDWAKTWPETPGYNDRIVANNYLDTLVYKINDTGKPWESTSFPTQSQTETTSEVQLYELIGKDYDDPLWDTLLDSLTIKQMANVITGTFNTGHISTIGKPRTIDADGPAGFVIFMEMGQPTVYDTCFYVSECILAATWNLQLAEAMGRMVGNEGIWGNQRGDGSPYSGWYAPAVNIHRTPFSGRNWEYYSEDGFISGKMAASVIKGAMSRGVYTYIKHFAVNDQETNRDSFGLFTWLSEQSMREIYLRPFEIAVKEGKTTAMMSSFNRIGDEWAGGSHRLLTEILRYEWGFTGMVCTDFNLQNYMSVNQMVRAGGDFNIGKGMVTITNLTATQATNIRRAAKNILYTVANSNAMNGIGRYAMPWWQIFLILANVAFAVGFAVWGFFAIKGAYKQQKRYELNDRRQLTDIGSV